MKSGHANLQAPVTTTNRFNLVNSNATDGSVRAFVQTTQGSLINTNATDKAISFSSINMRNQAQTHQVEVQITNNTTITLGFDQGTDLTEPIDTDNDGMDDDWETTNFGNLNRDGTGDADGDGLTDLQEFILLSNPNNASSGRPAVGVGQTAGGFRLSFPTAAGRNYQVQVRDEVSSGDWTSTGSVIAGDGSTKTHDDLTVLPRRFYRVQVTKP
jgi:hypothetical protein